MKTAAAAYKENAFTAGMLDKAPGTRHEQIH